MEQPRKQPGHTVTSLGNETSCAKSPAGGQHHCPTWAGGGRHQHKPQRQGTSSTHWYQSPISKGRMRFWDVMKQHDMADAMIFVHKLLFKVNYPHLRLFNGEIHKSIEYQNFQNIYLSLVLFFKTFSIWKSPLTGCLLLSHLCPSVHMICNNTYKKF